MGQSREAKKTNRMLDQEYSDTSRQYNDYNTSREGYANEARGRSDQAYNTAYGGYQRYLDNYFDNPPSSGGNSEARAGYRRYANGGGITDENKARIRGKGVFDEFARTGGYNEGDKTNIRSRLTSTIPAFYDAIRQQMQRQNVGMGGAGPTFDASLDALARQQSQAAGDATRDAELEINDRVNQGRQWGSSALSGAELGLVDATQRGETFGISGLRDLEGQDAQTDLANRGLTLQALQGLRGLRTDTPGEVSMYEGAIGNNMNAGANNRSNILQQRAAYNPNQSWLERMAPLINAGVGIGTSFLPGGAARGIFNRNRNSGVSGYRQTPGTSSAGQGYYGVF
jgi:hypothetical protein